MKVDIEKLAALAQIALTGQEQEELEAELALILASLDLPGDAPPQDPLPCRLRADEARPGLPREELLAAAPAQREGMILVPRVVE